MKAPLLIEIGCEEIPARMIPAAASDLAARTGAILDQAGLAHGAVSSWGGTRRLAVRIDDVEARQADRSEQVLGPPASAAFDAGGKPTSAAAGFARKQGVAPEALRRIETEKGVYAGFQRDVAGRSVGEVLASTFPAAVAAMAFPKTMRWGSGAHRWVRPVHWLLAIHGGDVLPIELFEVRAGGSSMGHRFLAQGAVKIADPGAYAGALRAAFVLADPDERRKALSRRLAEAAAAAGGELVEDASLLEEVVDLVEWPGVVAGRFDDRFLDLPREILVTTLRHHQKSFSVQRGDKLLPVFLSVANTDRDPAGHVRRGNEWVVSGRLEDARFFWDEDRRTPLSARLETLRRVTFHQKVGSYADKAERVANLAAEIARRVGLDDQRDIAVARDAGRLAKTDLVTGLVGEFPELQGIAGGLLLRGEGSDPAVADGVYEHYKPVGPEDGVPSSVTGAIVSLADKLDTVAALTAVGEAPTGSRDPFGLRRAVNGAFRILLERGWPFSVPDLALIANASEAGLAFLEERFRAYLLDRGFTANEVKSVLSATPIRLVSSAGEGSRSSRATERTLDDVLARLEAIRTVRGRRDFEHLVDLTKRVDNILTKNAGTLPGAEKQGYVETQPAAAQLATLVEESHPRMLRASEGKKYADTIEMISSFVAPVNRFFEEVLVIDPSNPVATAHRCELLGRVGALLTTDFDIRELAGQADRRA